MTLADLFTSLASDHDLARMEACLKDMVSVGDQSIGDIATHLIKAGGKRLRPALAIACASLGNDEVGEETILGAVSVELVHLASLYHDDVMDEAPRRRNVVSVNALWGNHLAIVAGDFLLARSAEIAAGLGNEIASLIASTLSRLCQGQVAEVRAAYQVDRTQSAYFSAIAGKTAALMSTACRIGGLTGHLTTTEIEALTVYGERLGMVFQIRDDIMDIIATEAVLGKAPGQDLAEGVYTLPVQYALLDAEASSELRQLLGKPLENEELDVAIAIVSRSGGIEAAAYTARQYADEAVQAVRALGDGPVTTALADLALNLLDDLDASAEVLAS